MGRQQQQQQQRGRTVVDTGAMTGSHSAVVVGVGVGRTSTMNTKQVFN